MSADEFWSARPVLKHVQDFARARRVCPWSTLGVVLVHAACQIPPRVVLPPLIGGHAAPNIPIALVGPPGAGKGASEATGRDAVHFTGLPAIEIPEFPLGSGEGVGRTFADAGAETIYTAIFSAPEAQTLEALFRRQGSTLEAEIRKLTMGEQLGFANAQKETRNIVPRLSYRAGLIIGVQPLKARVLLAGADGGTPQRFIWFPVLDGEMPELRPNQLDPIEVEVPPWPIPDSGRYVELVVPDVAKDAVDAHQFAMHRGDPDVDPLDGHALLTRIKVASGLMILDGRRNITVEDWSLAGDVMAVSNVTRANVQRAMDQARRRENRAKAHDVAERDEIIADRKFRRCKQTIERWLDNADDGEQIARHDLRRKVRAELRQYFDTAIAQLIDEGRIAEVTVDAGTAYTCTRRTRPPTSEDDPCTSRTRVHPDTDGGHSDQAKRNGNGTPPGGPTEGTPGYTNRVQQIVANVSNAKGTAT